MKKLLSIILSVMLLLGTLSVLTLLPVTANTGSASPANLLVNGGAEGATDPSDNTFKRLWTTADNESGGWLKLTSNAYGWYASNEFGNAASVKATDNISGSGMSNYTGDYIFKIGPWQSAVQDILIEEGKTYVVSAKIATQPNTITADGTFNMWISPSYGADTYATGAVRMGHPTKYNVAKPWVLFYGYSDVKTSITNYCATNTTYTYNNATYYYDGDFVEYSFTFNSNEFIEYNSSSLVKTSDGKYKCSFAIMNSTAGSVLFDDASIYEVVSITNTDGGAISGATTAFAGEQISVTASPYYGNKFLGWYDSSDKLVSSNAVYSGSAQDLVAKFDCRNQITNGDFEVSTAHTSTITEYNSYATRSSDYRGTYAITENTDGTQYGEHVLQLTPSSNTTSNAKKKSLISFPVTIEKDTDYIWRFSYKWPASGNGDWLYIGLDTATTLTTDSFNMPVSWTKHLQLSGKGEANFANRYEWNSGSGYTTLTNYNIWYTGDKWIDVYFMFNSGSSSDLFGENNEAEIYLTLGSPVAKTNTYYIDNMSFSEAESNTMNTVTAGENGSISKETDRVGENYYWYATGAGRADSTENALNTLVKTETYYPSIYEAYCATPDLGYQFAGWYDGETLLSRNANETFLMTEGKNITAKFEEKIGAKVRAVINEEENHVVPGYITGTSAFTAYEGDTVTVEAVPYEGNTFAGWKDSRTGEIVSTDNPATITIDSTEDRDYIATFNINNIWPNSGFENIEINTQMIFDKMETPTLYNGVWYLKRPCHWWSGIIMADPKDSANKILRLSTRTNEAMCDAAVKPNTEYELSFDWMLSVNASGNKLDFVKIYDSNGMEIAKKTGCATTTEYQRFTMNFNSGDNETISASIQYYAGSGYIYLDNICLREVPNYDGYYKVTYNVNDSHYPNFVDYVEKSVAEAGGYTTLPPFYYPVGMTRSTSYVKWEYAGTNYAVAAALPAFTSDITVNAVYTVSTKANPHLSAENPFDTKDYDYSFVVFPDPQCVDGHYPGYYEGMGQWVVDNTDTYNFKGLINVGDITNENEMPEWRRAYKTYSKLDGIMPYIMAAGNHDYMEARTAKTNKNSDEYVVANERNTEYYDYTFSEQTLIENNGTGDYYTYGGSYNGSLVNSYYKVEIDEDNKYIIMALELFPRDEILNWASAIVSSNPDYKIIVVTHSNLSGDGIRMENENNYYGANNPADSNNSVQVWEKFVSQHENMFMYICGHTFNENTLVRNSVGVNGNTVYEMLINTQSDDLGLCGLGNAVIMGFKDGKVTVTTYSILRDAYYNADTATYVLDIDGTITSDSTTVEYVTGNEEYLKLTASADNAYSMPVPIEPGQKVLAHFKLKALSGNGNYSFRLTDSALSSTVSSLTGKTTVSSAYGKSSSIETTIFEGSCADGYKDVYMYIDGSSITEYIEKYITFDLDGTFAIDNIWAYNASYLAPKMLGASLKAVDNPEEITYITSIDLPMDLTVGNISTYAAAYADLEAEGIAGTKFTADSLSDGRVGVASLSSSGDTHMVMDGQTAFTEGKYYANFKLGTVSQTARYSARSAISLTDAYGNDLGITLDSCNIDSIKGTTDGIYTRSITQVKRLMARKMINVYQIPRGSLPASNPWNEAIDKVWAFILANWDKIK